MLIVIESRMSFFKSLGFKEMSPLTLVDVAETPCCIHVRPLKVGIGYLASWKTQDGFRRRSGEDSIVLKYHTAV